MRGQRLVLSWTLLLWLSLLGVGAPVVSGHLPWMLWIEPWQLLSEQHLGLPPSFHPVQPFPSRP